MITRTVYVLAWNGEFLTDLKDGQPVWTSSRVRAMKWIEQEQSARLLRAIPSIMALEGAKLMPVTLECADANYPTGWRIANA